MRESIIPGGLESISPMRVNIKDAHLLNYHASMHSTSHCAVPQETAANVMSLIAKKAHLLNQHALVDSNEHPC